MKHPQHRHQIGSWLNDNGLTGEGAEIGVLHGTFSEIILKQWAGKMLHLIDPWESQSSEIYREITNMDQEFWDAAFNETIRNMFPYNNRVRIHKMLSCHAVKEFDDCQLDFVFIDGNHSYDSVVEDLNLWWPKVKSGGLFSGHDYENSIDDGKYCQVKKAVDEFVDMNGLSVYTTECSSWWIIK